MDTGALHLFHLDADGQDRLALRKVSALDIAVPEEPITTMEELKMRLTEVLDELPGYEVERVYSTQAMKIRMPPARTSHDHPLVHRARVLAAAYLEGEPGRAVFPFIAM